jgi:hypothetical protein
MKKLLGMMAVMAFSFMAMLSLSGDNKAVSADKKGTPAKYQFRIVCPQGRFAQEAVAGGQNVKEYRIESTHDTGRKDTAGDPIYITVLSIWSIQSVATDQTTFDSVMVFVTEYADGNTTGRLYAQVFDTEATMTSWNAQKGAWKDMIYVVPDSQDNTKKLGFATTFVPAKQ